ncbi:YesN/AraC family two-component response regulator [Streptococcus rupicaprae]|uniref:YesN/AraC family two-component response regulator n=1 Tax=Streptococcus rupicaprae TaxID=759619 RepID=A0ABV2FI25_9STRE
MNIETLEQQLFELTESEKRYLKQQFFQYEHFPQDSQDTLQFLFKNVSPTHQDNSLFYIRKQSRFAPVPKHKTDVIELNYIYSGQSTQYVNNQKITLQQGDLIIIDSQTSHEVASPDYQDIVISMNISQEFFREHFLKHLQTPSLLNQFILQAISHHRSHNQYLLFQKSQDSTLHLIFQQLLSEIYNPKLLSSDVKNHFIQLIFLELIRSYKATSNGTSKDDHRQQLLLDILAYIDTHFASLTLEQIAQHFGYNVSYFSTLIKDYTGQTFKSLLQKRKLEASLPLLLHTKQAIRDISLEVGFSNQNQFYQLFQKIYGKTPAQYRREKTG